MYSIGNECVGKRPCGSHFVIDSLVNSITCFSWIIVLNAEVCVFLSVNHLQHVSATSVREKNLAQQLLCIERVLWLLFLKSISYCRPHLKCARFHNILCSLFISAISIVIHMKKRTIFPISHWHESFDFECAHLNRTISLSKTCSDDVLSCEYFYLGQSCIFSVPCHAHIHIQTTPHRTQINTFIIWIVLMNYLSMTHNSVIDFRVLFASRFYTQFLSLDFPWFFCLIHSVFLSNVLFHRDSNYHINKYLIILICLQVIFILCSVIIDEQLTFFIGIFFFFNRKSDDRQTG